MKIPSTTKNSKYKKFEVRFTLELSKNKIRRQPGQLIHKNRATEIRYEIIEMSFKIKISQSSWHASHLTTDQTLTEGKDIVLTTY